MGQSKRKEISIKRFKSEYEDFENIQDKSDLSYVPYLPQTIIKELDVRLVPRPRCKAPQTTHVDFVCL